MVKRQQDGEQAAKVYGSVSPRQWWPDNAENSGISATVSSAGSLGGLYWLEEIYGRHDLT